MANQPPSPDTGDDTGAGSGQEYPGTPRWVKVSAIIALILVLLIVIVLLFGGDHGPGRHLGSGDAGGHTVLMNHVLQQL